jgi:hypothetical protein
MGAGAWHTLGRAAGFVPVAAGPGRFALIADFDGDGQPDEVELEGFGDDSSVRVSVSSNRGQPLLTSLPESLTIAAFDYDNDGDIDILTNNRGDYPSLLRNDGGNANHWLEILLIGTKSNRDGIGASLKLTSEGISHVEQAKGGMSYMSANDPRIFFGLGKRTKIDSLEITWPSGLVEKLANVPIDKIIAVKEGAGIVPRNFPKITPKTASR